MPSKPQGDAAIAMAYSNVKYKEHEEIDAQVAEFLKRGKITVLEPNQRPTKTDAFNAFRDKTPEKTNTSTGRQNIYKSLKDGFKYEVVIFHQLIGRSNDIEEAVKMRDLHRDKIGIRKADY